MEETHAKKSMNPYTLPHELTLESIYWKWVVSVYAGNGKVLNDEFTQFFTHALCTLNELAQCYNIPLTTVIARCVAHDIRGFHNDGYETYVFKSDFHTTTPKQMQPQPTLTKLMARELENLRDIYGE
jgi:hypothetical protein